MDTAEHAAHRRERREEGHRRAGRHGRLAPWALSALLFTAGAASTRTAFAQETTREELRADAREAAHTHWGHARLRLGFSGVGGGFFGDAQGGIAGLAARVGVQLNDVVAIYLQGHGLIGEYAPDPRPTSLIGMVFHEGIIEVTLLDFLELGAGPSIDVIWGCEANNGGAYCGHSGAFFGGDFRIGFVAFNHHRTTATDSRHGLVFSIDAHPTWIGPQMITTMLFGIGGELD